MPDKMPFDIFIACFLKMKIERSEESNSETLICESLMLRTLNLVKNQSEIKI